MQIEEERDGVKIINKISAFLKFKNIPTEKRKLMLASFSEISKDVERDKPAELDKEVAKDLSIKSSTNKQIFTFIYKNIYKKIENYQR